MGQARIRSRLLGGAVLLGMLGGCMAEDLVDRASSALSGEIPAIANADRPALNGELSNGERSDLIDALLNRRSILAYGPYVEVANSVLAANARAAEADLRAAMLRSQAREMNWLPSLGPSVSLTSLGDVVAGLLVEQTLFDGGAKRAERAFARADVEVAAVALAEDTNARVSLALDLYLQAQAADARAAVNQGGLARMERFEYIMSERVRAGIDDRADLHLVQQRLTQMRSDILEDQEAAASARAELAAMAATDLSGVTGVAPLTRTASTAQPLAVMRREAEGVRGLAEARALVAGYRPNITASGTIGESDSAGLSVGIPNGFGFGRNADMAALEAMGQAAQRAVAEQREDTARNVAGIEGEIASLRRQQSQIGTIVAQARGNYELFEQQLQGGQRSVPDVVGVFRTKLEAEREAASLPFDLARQQLRLAELYGVLVDGDDI